MKTFVLYRKADISNTHNEKQRNSPDVPQLEGVVFDDEKTVIHWLTPVQSISVFDCFQQFMDIHGHPEYDTELVWTDTVICGGYKTCPSKLCIHRVPHLRHDCEKNENWDLHAKTEKGVITPCCGDEVDCWEYSDKDRIGV